MESAVLKEEKKLKAKEDLLAEVSLIKENFTNNTGLSDQLYKLIKMKELKL